jgi:hypothetical protein
MRGAAHVTELTGLLRQGPAGDQLAAWPAGMRVLARRERPAAGALTSARPSPLSPKETLRGPWNTAPGR